MAQYDPQRSRTRHRKADEEGPAPVDALLGPDPAVGAPAVPADGIVPVDTTVPSERMSGVDAVAPEWEPGEPSPSGPAWRPAVGLAAVIGLLALLWLVVRRRHPRGDEPSGH